ncbi:MAG: 50S ribosomal protein L6 [Cycloclasticus sp.]|nr:MAG: 50S ribosomal protein L6 [Cycloclasticus sp. Phe_18]MDF1689760.1 50S ribosomal protein L6 [Cycloclasticus sp.]MEE4290794.1 50S ribosomal protein L6 [Cycloclasticus sp.]
MSRIAKSPIELPAGVEFKNTDGALTIKGKNGSLTSELFNCVDIELNDNVLSFKPKDASKGSMALTGTQRSIVNNMVVGVTKGFEKKLELRGVGYRTQVKGQSLNLTLGFSHPVNYEIPEGITIETPSQTEIIVKGCDKQQVGQVAADIRDYRSPEPYKGKGIRYVGEHVVMKEAKKK